MVAGTPPPGLGPTGPGSAGSAAGARRRAWGQPGLMDIKGKARGSDGHSGGGQGVLWTFRGRPGGQMDSQGEVRGSDGGRMGIWLSEYGLESVSPYNR